MSNIHAYTHIYTNFVTGGSTFASKSSFATRAGDPREAGSALEEQRAEAACRRGPGRKVT